MVSTKMIVILLIVAITLLKGAVLANKASKIVENYYERQDKIILEYDVFQK